jgi:SAM-dependent methyltransferase
VSPRHRSKAYDADLAFIHDAGFGGFATAAAGTVIELLRAGGHQAAHVVELGCGSGLQAALVSKAGHRVTGYDVSPAMIELARQRVPAGKFHCASFIDATLPKCQVVTAVGEIFNYRFDRRNSLTTLQRVFRRVFAALAPGGTFLFDVALVGRVPEGRRRTYSEGHDWACLYEAIEDRERKSLTRSITTFRREGNGGRYRRDHEVHKLRLFQPRQLDPLLRATGFRVRRLAGYGDFAFPPGYVGYLCARPR